MLTNSLRMLLRRLPWVLVALVLAMGAGGVTAIATPPMQASTASVLFVPSVKQPGVAGPTNPLLALNGSVAVIASVLQIAVTDDETSLRLASRGHTSDYKVEPDLGENAGPVLLISVEDSDPRKAEGTRDAVVNEIKERLKFFQDQRSVPSDLRVDAVLLTSSPRPIANHKPQIQLGMAAASACLAILLGLILLIERRSGRLPHRRSGEHEAKMDDVAPQVISSSDDSREGLAAGPRPAKTLSR